MTAAAVPTLGVVLIGHMKPGWHTEHDAAPGLGLKLPTAHGLQLDCCRASWNVPGTQSVHEGRAGALENLPTGQAQHDAGRLKLAQKVPMGQLMHDAELAGATDPVGH